MRLALAHPATSSAVFPGVAKAEDLPKNFDHAASEQKRYDWRAAPSQLAPCPFPLAHLLAPALELESPVLGDNTPPSPLSFHTLSAFHPLSIADVCVSACPLSFRWEQHGHFKPRGTGAPFVIAMPPPNVTGALHMGHAMFVTLQARGADRNDTIIFCRCIADNPVTLGESSPSCFFSHCRI